MTRGQSRGNSRGRSRGGGSLNPRDNVSPLQQKVDQTNFQTWGRNDAFPNTQSNQLMNKMQAATTRQEQSPGHFLGFLNTKRGNQR